MVARWWTDGTIDWLWPAAEAAGIPVGLLANGRLDVIAAKAVHHPALRIQVEHLAVDHSARGADAFTELADVIGLARFPNVAVTLSGVPDASMEPYPFRDVHEPIRRVIDAFGPSRVFWASDLTRLRHPYRDPVTALTEEMPWLTGAHLDLVMGRGVCDWLDWAAS